MIAGKFNIHIPRNYKRANKAGFPRPGHIIKYVSI